MAINIRVAPNARTDSLLRRLGGFAVVVICLVSLVLPLRSDEADKFEAVAITRGPADRPPMPHLDIGPMHLRAQGASFHYLLTQAFGIEEYQLSGTGGWMDSEPYAINATAGRGVSGAQMMTMLRDMLMTRFQLKLHHEQRAVMPVFALTVDRSGPKLVPLGQDEDPTFREQTQQDGDQITQRIGSSVNDLIRYINSRKGEAAVGRPVVDQTGLQGLYKIRLTFGIELNPDGRGGKFTIDWPSALIRQLGLRLEPTKAAVDVLVVDSAARPDLDR